MKRRKTIGDDQERRRHKASTDWQEKRVKAWIFWLCNNEPLQSSPSTKSVNIPFFSFPLAGESCFSMQESFYFRLQVAGESECNCPACAWDFRFNRCTKWQIWRACVCFIKVGEITESMQTAANRQSEKKKHAEHPLERNPLSRLGETGEKEKENWQSVRPTNKGCEEDNKLTARGEVGDWLKAGEGSS